MNKFLPYTPLAVLIIGTFMLQISSMNRDTGLLSNTLSTVSGEVSPSTICTKPEDFSNLDEIAWCDIGLAANIEQHLNTWNWSCIVGKEIYLCHFTENREYKTRGGVFFRK